jgi:hypothetical protein
VSWKTKARKIAAGNWIKFDEKTPAVTLTFTGEPELVQKEVQQGPRKGEKYEQMSFPVLVEGEEKRLEPNKSLLNVIIDEDDDEEIMNRTFVIKCLDLTSKRQWKIREVGGQQAVSRQWKGNEDKERAEDAKEPEAIPEKEKQDKEELEHFKKKVAAHTKKQKAKEKKEEEEKQGEEGNADTSTDGPGES